MSDWSQVSPRSYELVQQGIESELHIGAQLYVSRDSKPLIHQGLGLAQLDGAKLTTDTLMLWLSSGKPLTAVAILQLWERNLLDISQTVTEYIPEFGTGGKAPITIYHLLTHTGGFRLVDIGWPETTWAEVIERICDAPLEADWQPGQKAGYHASTSWYILGEIIQRVTGESLINYLRKQVFFPLEMPDCHLGMTPEAYEAYGSRIAVLPHMNLAEGRPHRLADRRGCLWTSPGENLYGPAGQFAHFYETLLNRGRYGDYQLLQPETVQQMVTRHREGMFDESFRHVIDWGLGVILDSKQHGIEALPYGYGKHASSATFGHSGNQSSTAFADPKHQLVVALAFNGMPGERAHQKRIKPVLEALYEDLGLVSQ